MPNHLILFIARNDHLHNHFLIKIRRFKKKVLPLFANQ